MRVAQFIGQSGFTSRQKAKQLIDEKRVKVNGKIATHSTKISDGDEITVDGKNIHTNVLIPVEKISAKKKKPESDNPIYIAYYKPQGIVCTTEGIENNILDAVNHPFHILPVGRLDKDSEGLILLTNVRSIIDRIINPKFRHEKEYEVTLNLPVSSGFIREVAMGVDIGGVKTLPAEVIVVPGTKRVFRIILQQGVNRQIRRMCNVFGYQVVKLKRLRVLNVRLDKLKPGEWRHLSQDELEILLSKLY